MFIKLVSSIFISLSFVQDSNAQDAANFLIEKSYWCEDMPRQEVKLYIRPLTFAAGSQLVDLNLVTPIPLGNDVKISLSVDMEIGLGGKHYQHLFAVDDDFCRVIQVYLGELAYDIEQSMAIPRHACPIPKAQNAANFVIEKFYLCENQSHQLVKLHILPKTFVHEAQVVDITLITPIALGNDLRFGCSVDMEIAKHWQYLVSFEDDFCRIVEMYIGELGYQVEYAMAIPRKTCPIPKGNYHAVNFTMNFAKLKLQTFPFGRLRSTFQFIQKSTRHSLLCGVAIIANNI